MSFCISSHYLSAPIKKPVSASSMSHYIIFDREEVIRERNKGGRERDRVITILFLERRSILLELSLCLCSWVFKVRASIEFSHFLSEIKNLLLWSLSLFKLLLVFFLGAGAGGAIASLIPAWSISSSLCSRDPPKNKSPFFFRIFYPILLHPWWFKYMW